MQEGRSDGPRPLARSSDDVRALHQLCREGRFAGHGPTGSEVWDLFDLLLELFIGWSAIQGATLVGHLPIFKRLGPDPACDDFDGLYRFAKDESIVAFLATLRPPEDLTPESDSPVMHQQDVEADNEAARRGLHHPLQSWNQMTHEDV